MNLQNVVIMATSLEPTTSKEEPKEHTDDDALQLEKQIERISIDDVDAVEAVNGLKTAIDNEDDEHEVDDGDVIATEPNATENCSSSSSKSDCNEITSNIPPGFNDIDHIFHIDFMRSMQSLISQQEKRYVQRLVHCTDDWLTSCLCCCQKVILRDQML